MDETTRQYWDKKYEQGLPSLTKPDPFFISVYERYVGPAISGGGVALDLAGGLGRHALWLAQRDWQVSLVELSVVALDALRKVAEEMSVHINIICGDAADYDMPAEQYDLIVLFYHLDRRLFPRIVHALKPGGLFVCKMRLRWSADHEQAREQDPLLSPNELLSLLPGLAALDHNQRRIGERGVVEYAGRKPGALGLPGQRPFGSALRSSGCAPYDHSA